MNYIPLIDNIEERYCAKLIDIMKNFNVPLDFTYTDLCDLLDVRSIMKQGKIQDLAKCVQNVLNYNFNSLASSGNIRVLDPSFVSLFHVAQFIIKFLLFWKTDLLNENMKMRNQLEELEKIRKDYFVKKIEIRSLRKQLLLHSKSKSTSVSECSQCKKVFVNDTYLYAHYKRRHEDTEPSISNSQEIQILQNEIQHLKQRLRNITEASNKPIKMKLMPETACLETQEKYWKGRLKEKCDYYEGEIQLMKSRIEELENQNILLQNKLDDTERIPETISLGVQTEKKNCEPCLCSQQLPYVENSSNDTFSTFSLTSRDFNLNSVPKLQFSASPFNSKPEWICSLPADVPTSTSSTKKLDIINEVNSFLVSYRKKYEKQQRSESNSLVISNNDERREQAKKVISKLFSSNESSEQLADKLIKIYDKRLMLMDEDAYEVIAISESKGEKIDNIDNDVEQVIDLLPVDEPPKTNNNGSTTFNEFNIEVVEETQTAEAISNVHRELTTRHKSKILPFFRNIPIKIMKNYTKTRKACTNVIGDKIISRLPPSYECNKQLGKKENAINIGSSVQARISSDDELIESEQSSSDVEKISVPENSSERILVSALKKSKSTGNIVKKVAFSDELPTFKTNSESNLLELSCCGDSSIKSVSTKNKVIGTFDVHYDGFQIPIPAPRARKNIESSSDIIRNMK